MKKQTFLSFIIIVLIIFSGLFISFRVIAQEETNPPDQNIEEVGVEGATDGNSFGPGGPPPKKKPPKPKSTPKPTPFQITLPECKSGCSPSINACPITCASGNISTPPIKPGSLGSGCCCCPIPIPTPKPCGCTDDSGNNLVEDGFGYCSVNSSTGWGIKRTCSAIATLNGCVASWNEVVCTPPLSVCSIQNGKPSCNYPPAP